MQITLRITNQQQLSLSLPEPSTCQRWNRGNTAFRPSGELIDPRRYGVDILTERTARAFIERHHYAHSYPAARLAVGLYESSGCGSRLAGVAVFSVPMNNAVIPHYTGLAPAKGVELGRFVLLDSVPGNGETHFLGLAFRALRQALPGIRAVVSYSDPVARISATGRIIKIGHLGGIYASHNGRFFGRSNARTLLLSRDGRVLSQRTLSKLRNDERGAEGAYRQIRSLGAPARGVHEDMTAYLNRAVREGGFVRARHPGNLAYGWPIGGPQERRRLRAGFLPACPRQRVLDAPIILPE